VLLVFVVEDKRSDISSVVVTLWSVGPEVNSFHLGIHRSVLTSVFFGFTYPIKFTSSGNINKSHHLCYQCFLDHCSGVG